MAMGIKFTLIGVLAAATLAAQGPGGRAGGFRGGPGGPGGPFGMMGLGIGRTPVTGAPYSAVRTTDSVRSLAGGNQIEHQDQSKVYRSSQGQVRVEQTFTPPAGAANQSPRTAITIFDPVAGNITRLDPQTKTAFQMQLKTPNGSQSGDAHPHNNSNQANVQTTDLGSQIVNGVNATGVRTTLTIAAGAIGNTQPIQVVREVWTSTDLKVPVLVKVTDPRSGNSTSQLTSIVRAEPDASLFQVPSDYTIKTGGGGGRGPQSWRGNR